jgi:hypothetical protein
VTACHGDYAWAEAFFSEFEMGRDKTLMEDYDCCDYFNLFS